VKYADERRLLSVSWNYTGEQYSTIDNAIKPLAAFDTVDMAMMQKFTLLKLDLALDLKLKNIFDKRYEIYAYTPQPGFNCSCGLTLSYHLQ
jgi:outer membrane cobalamin receptor